MSETRRLARADLAAVFADPAALPVEDFLDRWFAPEAQTRAAGARRAAEIEGLKRALALAVVSVLVAA